MVVVGYFLIHFKVANTNTTLIEETFQNDRHKKT